MSYRAGIFNPTWLSPYHPLLAHVFLKAADAGSFRARESVFSSGRGFLEQFFREEGTKRQS